MFGRKIFAVMFTYLLGSLVLFSLSAQAGVIKSSTVIRHNSTLAGIDSKEVSDPYVAGVLVTPYVLTSVTAGESSAQNYTGQGFAGGGISSKERYGVSSLAAEFRIDNIVITNNDLRSGFDPVAGSIHTTYAALFSNYLEGNSWLNMGLDISGAAYQSHRVLESDSGLWEVNNVFNLNTAFSLKFNAEFVISNLRQDNNEFLGSGGYHILLGGSPVFNLPDGYVANSVDGSIVNNYFVGTDPFRQAPSSVPEPASILFMISGLLCLLFKAGHDKLSVHISTT